MTVAISNERMTGEQAAAYIGILPGTLATWRSTGRYAIPYQKIGAKVFYRRADLDAWLASRTATSTAAHLASASS